MKALEIVKNKIELLNTTEFVKRGLVAQYSFDPGVYIKRSMGLLGSNLLIGIFLAIGILWLFLR